MTPEDIDRAIEEYEKALAFHVTNARHYDGQIMFGAQGFGFGRLRDLIQDIEALNYIREQLANPETEGAQE